MSNAAALNGEDFNPMTEGLRDGQRLSLDVTRLGSGIAT